MHEKAYEVVVSSLLHDVGKLYGRAEGIKRPHDELGAEYIQSKTGKDYPYQILNPIRYHHERKIREAGLEELDSAYLVCEADNISSAADRRKIAGDPSSGWDKYTPLKSVFNVLGHEEGKASEFAYELQSLKVDNDIGFPRSEDQILVSQQRYQYVFQEFDAALTRFFEDSHMSLNSLLKLVELTFHTIPSSTDRTEQADISLYHHSKTTGMIASCLYYYLEEKGIKSYKEWFLENKEKSRMEPAYRLVSGDVSGIQNFLYKVPSKGALKSLRGRSFYLEILVEHIIDEILEESGLSRANLMYSGGGHFYLLMPNTRKTADVLAQARDQINRWFFGQYGVDLYVEIGSVAACAHDLANQLSEKQKASNELGELYRKAAAEISRGKLSRYNTDFLSSLFTPREGSGRECPVCGLDHETLVERNGGSIGENCLALLDLGATLARLDGSKGKYFAGISSCCPERGGAMLPGIRGETRYLDIKEQSLIERDLQEGTIERVYSINNDSFGSAYANNLWAGTYNVKDRDEGLVDFQTLSEASIGDDMIAVLRADVDNLGVCFRQAFIDKSSQNPYQFVSLSRTASLSYVLSQFFKLEINKIARQRNQPEQFVLPITGDDEGYNLVLVYSGGDDVFAVGSWNDVLEFAVNLNRDFRRYTQGKLSMSAGIGVFPKAYPLVQMARITGELEQQAKESGKNALCLFGAETGAFSEEEHLKQYRHCYRWEDFTERVCADKLDRLFDWFAFQDESGKIPYAASGFYRLRLLVNELLTKDRPVNLARMAYAVARMEPKEKPDSPAVRKFQEFKQTFYSWVQDRKELQELYTAMTLAIYLTRRSESK